MATGPGNSHNQIPEILFDDNRVNDSNNASNTNDKLRANDLPTQKLLLEVAKHVKYSEANLLKLAVDVGMPEGRFTQKTRIVDEALMKIFEVKYRLLSYGYFNNYLNNIKTLINVVTSHFRF